MSRMILPSTLVERLAAEGLCVDALVADAVSYCSRPRAGLEQDTDKFGYRDVKIEVRSAMHTGYNIQYLAHVSGAEYLDRLVLNPEIPDEVYADFLISRFHLSANLAIKLLRDWIKSPTGKPIRF